MVEKRGGKYQVPIDEGYEPNSNNEVLKNYLHITEKSEIEALEEEELNRVISELEGLFSKNYQFSSEDLCAIHEAWLGDIYLFAGKYRTVNMSKDDFTFAAANRIEDLMHQFDVDFLQKYTPCNFQNLDEVIKALAVVHVEFILIHPFREGNGRVGRLLASLMANQAELPPLIFDSIDQTKNVSSFDKYIKAIHKGLEGDYFLMEEIFREVIRFSLARS